MRIILFVLFIFISFGCGVRSAPLPPLTPAQLGHGQPSYRKAIEKTKINSQQIDQEQDWETDKTHIEDEGVENE